MGSGDVSRRQLTATAHALVGCRRGLLAMDGSEGTFNSQLAEAGIAPSEATRHAYRLLVATVPHLSTCISGTILNDGTMRQKTVEGVPLPLILAQAGILPGISVDISSKERDGHSDRVIHHGLGELRERLLEYRLLGARFATWRSVIALGPGPINRAGIGENAEALACHAAVCQEAGLVPIVEPKILMVSNHSLKHCRAITETVLHAVFDALYERNVVLEGFILKSNMIVPGPSSESQPANDIVAGAMVTSLIRTVPEEVAGIACLSEWGHSGELASKLSNAITNKAGTYRSRVPWPLMFSVPCTVQRSLLEIWGGQSRNTLLGQEALYEGVQRNYAALRGTYTANLEAA
jgi:fructose-bisphosphate aldolase class I